MTKIQAIKACFLPGLVILLIIFSQYQHACLLRIANSFAVVPWSLHGLSMENHSEHTLSVSGATGAMYKIKCNAFENIMGRTPPNEMTSHGIPPWLIARVEASQCPKPGQS